MTESLGSDPGIGECVRRLRTELGLSLDEIAARSDLDAAMIGRIETGELFPVASIVMSLCAAFGVTLGELLRSSSTPGTQLNRRADQLSWSQPGSVAVCRKLTPDGTGALSDLIEFEFPPGGVYEYKDPPPLRGVDRQLLIIDGTLEVTIHEAGEATTYVLTAGDCFHLPRGSDQVYRNPSGRMTRCIAVITRA